MHKEVVVGNWMERYFQAVHGQGSMLRLLRCGMAAVQESGNAALRSKISGERFVAPYVLCDALDEAGVPLPTSAASSTTMDTQQSPTSSRSH